jgi:hypothetical protein
MRRILAPALIALLWTSLALAQGSMSGTEEAPKNLEMTKPPEATPGGGPIGGYEADTLRRMEDWQKRVVAFREKAQNSGDAKARGVASQLDREMVTVKDSWERVRQTESTAKAEDQKKILEGAFDRLETLWNSEVAER